MKAVPNTGWQLGFQVFSKEHQKLDVSAIIPEIPWEKVAFNCKCRKHVLFNPRINRLHLLDALV